MGLKVAGRRHSWNIISSEWMGWGPEVCWLAPFSVPQSSPHPSFNLIIQDSQISEFCLQDESGQFISFVGSGVEFLTRTWPRFLPRLAHSSASNARWGSFIAWQGRALKRRCTTTKRQDPPFRSSCSCWGSRCACEALTSTEHSWTTRVSVQHGQGEGGLRG